MVKSSSLKGKMIVFVIFMYFFSLLYRPLKNDQNQNRERDIITIENAGPFVSNALINACYDCHSNYTRYKWFDHIPPISWIVDHSIQKGKYVLNFSEWDSIPNISKGILFSAIPYNMDTNRMPPKNYQLLHKAAQLSDEEKASIKAWLIEVKQRMVFEKDDEAE